MALSVAEVAEEIFKEAILKVTDIISAELLFLCQHMVSAATAVLAVYCLTAWDLGGVRATGRCEHGEIACMPSSGHPPTEGRGNCFTSEFKANEISDYDLVLKIFDTLKFRNKLPHLVGLSVWG